MLYTRNINSGTILKKLDVELATLNPQDLQTELAKYASAMMDTTDPEPIVIPVDYLTGFDEAPIAYNIQVVTPRIAVFIEGKGSRTATNFVWYDGNESLTITKSVSNDSLVFLTVKGSRLVVDGKTIYVNCADPMDSYIRVFFLDLWGIPQCMKLRKGKFSYKYEADGNYRPYNGQVAYEYHKKPTFALTVNDATIDNRLRAFLDGLSASETYYGGCQWCDEIFPCILTSVEVSADKFNEQLSITGSLAVDAENMKWIEDEKWREEGV